jgi:hypothetical protein
MKLRENQRSHVNKREREQLEELCTMNAGVQKQNLAQKRGGGGERKGKKKENHQQRDYFSKLEEKL